MAGSVENTPMRASASPSIGMYPRAARCVMLSASGVSASKTSAPPMPHAPAVSAVLHQGSEYHPVGTGRPETRPPG